tara:strand:+ start:184 stop:399 length:216 start_codon:yes stop_codon:yes gene_type:complete
LVLLNTAVFSFEILPLMLPEWRYWSAFKEGLYNKYGYVTPRDKIVAAQLHNKSTIAFIIFSSFSMNTPLYL